MPAGFDRGKQEFYSRAGTRIDLAHARVHEGYHFFGTNEQIGAAAAGWMIVTPNTTAWAHMAFALGASAAGVFSLYEGADRNAGNAITVFNSDRNSAITSAVTLSDTPAGGTTDGTLIRVEYCPGATGPASRRTGGQVDRGDLELILKQGTKYVLRWVADAGNPNAFVGFYWYDLTNMT